MLDLVTIQSLFKVSPIASIILFPDTPFFTIVWVNPSCLLLTEAKLCDVVGLSIFEELADADSEFKQNDTLSDSLTKSLNFKSAATTKVQRYKKGTQIFGGDYWECSTYPLLDENENVAFLVVNLQAVKEQELLYGNDKKTSNILESIKDGFFVLDKDWIVKYWNKEAERILHLPHKQVIGRSLWDVFPEFQNSVINDAYQKAKSEYTSIHLEEYYGPLNLWVEISAFPSDQGLSVHFKDITAKKQNELTITALNKQYQDLFDLSPLPQFVYTIDDLSIKDVNMAAIEHYGYSKAEFISMTIMDLTPQEDLQVIEQILKENVIPDGQYLGIFRHLKNTGEIIDVQVAGNPIIFKGECARLVLAEDITEKIRTRMALQRSEQRYKALVQDGSDMVGILNSKGEYLYVNQTSKRILGIPGEFFIGKNAFDFIHENDQERFMTTLAQLPHQQSMKIPAFLFKDSKGKYRWIDTTVTNMTNDPAVGGIIANSRDVTERIVNEIKMKRSMERFDIVAKATSDAIWDYDATTGIIIWNKAIKALFGYKMATCATEWWEDRVHPDDLPRVNKKVMSMIKGKKSRLKNEYRFRCADNSYKNVLDRSFSIYNGAGELVRRIGSMQDITASEMYVQTVEAQNQRLKEIAWTQSHVVRAPLANIMGLVELLAEGMADDDGPQKDLIVHLCNSSAELDLIIREIIRKTEMYGKG